MRPYTPVNPRCNALLSDIRAAASAAFIDRVIETKGLDAIDRHKAKKHGKYLVESQIFSVPDYCA